MAHAFPLDGEDVQAIPLVGRSHGFRAEHVPLRIEPALGQVSEKLSSSCSKQTWDVLHEHDARSHLANQPGDLGPEPPLVLGASLLPCVGEGLAGESGSDKVHSASEEGSVQSREVGPDRRVSHETRLNRCIQTRDGK